MNTTEFKQDEVNISCISRKVLQHLKLQSKDIFNQIEDLIKNNICRLSYGSLICEDLENSKELLRKIVLSQPFYKELPFSFLPIYGINKDDTNIHGLVYPSSVDDKDTKYRNIGVCPLLKNQAVSYRNRSNYSRFVLEIVFSKLIKFDRKSVYQKLVEEGEFCNFTPTLLVGEESKSDYMAVEFPFSDIKLLSVLPVLNNLIEFDYPQSLSQINIGCR
jgi:hypothetical protein